MSLTIQVCSLCGNFLDDDGECGECSHADNSTLSFQVGGNHYKDSTIQPIEYITANNLVGLPRDLYDNLVWCSFACDYAICHDII